MVHFCSTDNSIRRILSLFCCCYFHSLQFADFLYLFLDTIGNFLSSFLKQEYLIFKKLFSNICSSKTLNSGKASIMPDRKKDPSTKQPQFCGPKVCRKKSKCVEKKFFVFFNDNQGIFKSYLHYKMTIFASQFLQIIGLKFCCSTL